MVGPSHYDFSFALIEEYCVIEIGTQGNLIHQCRLQYNNFFQWVGKRKFTIDNKKGLKKLLAQQEKVTSTHQELLSDGSIFMNSDFAPE